MTSYITRSLDDFNAVGASVVRKTASVGETLNHDETIDYMLMDGWMDGWMTTYPLEGREVSNVASCNTVGHLALDRRINQVGHGQCINSTRLYLLFISQIQVVN